MAANGKVSCSSSSIVRSFKNFLLQLLIFISEIAEEGFQGLSQSTGCFFLGLWKRTFFGNRERVIFCNVTMLCKSCWMLAKSAQKKNVLKQGTSAEKEFYVRNATVIFGRRTACLLRKKKHLRVVHSKSDQLDQTSRPRTERETSKLSIE